MSPAPSSHTPAFGRWIAAAIAAVALTTAGCAVPTVASPSTGSTTAPAVVVDPSTKIVTPVVRDTERPGAAPTKALAVLATLPVKGRAPKTGYARSQFGQAWSDDVTVAGGHNGCDTRNDILGRDLTHKVYKVGTRDCVVMSGTLTDPYTATTIAFTRGSTSSSAVQIDHVVALSDAWQKGAQQLSAQRRRDFANDPRNLQATDGPTNQRKGDGDAATWLPPNKTYRCTYVSRQIAVKADYHLWVTTAERDAMRRILTNCGAADATPPSSAPSSEPATEQAPPTTTRAPAAPAPAAPKAPSSVYYASCKAAKAAGAAPLYAGQPGYRAALDRDNDGVACESG